MLIINFMCIEVKNQVLYTHFYSHANLLVLGKRCYILQEREDKERSISAFVFPNVEIFDAVLVYACPKQALTLSLVLRNE